MSATRRLTSASLDALAAEAEGDVLEDRQVREEGVVLEDGVDVALVRRQPGDVLALELDQPGRRLLEAADHPQRRRLAAARGPEQREELAVLDLEVDVVDRDDVAEAFGDVDETDIDFGHGRPGPPPKVRADARRGTPTTFTDASGPTCEPRGTAAAG